MFHAYFVELELMILIKFFQIVVDMYLPLLFVRDGDSGACFRVGQGSLTRHGVVHFSDPLLIFPFSSLLFY